MDGRWLYEMSYTAERNANWYKLFGKIICHSLNKYPQIFKIPGIVTCCRETDS